MTARFVGSGARRSAITRRQRRVAAAVLGLVAGIVTLLALWPTPPVWLAGPRGVTVTALRWAREHMLTVAVASLVVGIAGVVVPVLLARVQRGWSRRDAADDRRRPSDRENMLKRVQRGWIADVLEQSLTEEARIRLGLTRRSDVIQRPGLIIRRPGKKAKQLPAGTAVSEVFENIGGGLLVLGVPGSGKTTALLELARDLLKQAEKDEIQPMPVVFNLSSWAARRPALDEWLIDELRTSYDVPRRIGSQWVANSEILPLLDGLDEVAKAHRAECVEAINAFRAEHGLVRFVVCSRTEEYKALARQLQVEDAVELQPPTAKQVSRYLKTAGPALADVRAALKGDKSLLEFLQSPLVLSIVALTYQDRPAKALRAARTRKKRLELLFTEYIERMFEHRHGRYTEPQMLRWLSCLARSMRQRDVSEFYVDRLRPDWLPTQAQQRLATLAPTISAGLGVGLVLGVVAGLLGGLIVGLITGLVAGLAFAFALASGLAGRLTESDYVEEFRWLRWSRPEEPYALVEEFRWSWDPHHVLVGVLTGAWRGGLLGVLGFTLFFGLLSWLHGGLSFALPGGLGLAGALIARLVGGLSGLVGVLVGALAFGLVSALVGALICALTYPLREGLADERSMPNEGIHRSARYACFYGLGFGVVFGLAAGPIVGLGVGLTVGFRFGWLACLQHLVIRGLLVRNGVAPWRYVDFLDEAKDRLFLRSTGSGYIFVHRLLLEHLAGLDTAHPPAAAEQHVAVPDPLPARRVRHLRGPEVGYPMGRFA